MEPHLSLSDEVNERIAKLDLPFNSLGLDPYGVSQKHVKIFISMLGVLYRHYFKVKTYGIEHVPPSGRTMIIGNHSGGLPVDAGMVLSSLFFEMDSPRWGHGMVEKFANNWPIVSQLFSRAGQFTGLPENAIRLLEDDRVLMVFPEGARGVGKLYKDRYKLVRFGTGFMRLALRTGSPIVPVAFIGGEEALPTIYHLRGLAKLIRAPYVPISSHILPIPLPVECSVHYGRPMVFKGNGNEDDWLIQKYVEQVRDSIGVLLREGLETRGWEVPEWTGQHAPDPAWFRRGRS